MFEKLNSSGYDLSEVELDQWVFYVRGGTTYVGTFYHVVRFMVTNYGFSLSDIDLAVQEMIEKGHDSVHFGIYKSMIHTFNREDNLKRAG